MKRYTDGRVVVNQDGGYTICRMDPVGAEYRIYTYFPDDTLKYYSVTSINGKKGVSRLYSPDDSLIEELQGNIGTSEYSEVWLKNGKLHRTDAPAYVVTDRMKPDYILIKWYRNGELHRDGGPALYLNEDGKIFLKWYQNGKVSRASKPAVIEINEDGSRWEYWYRDNELHRDDGPTIVGTDSDTQVIWEYWYQNGKQITDPQEIVKLKKSLKNQPTDNTRGMLEHSEADSGKDWAVFEIED